MARIFGQGRSGGGDQEGRTEPAGGSKKVTGAELEANLAAWRAERAAQRDARKQERAARDPAVVWRKRILVGCALVIATSAVIGGISASSSRSQAAALREQIVALQQSLVVAQSQAQDLKQNPPPDLGALTLAASDAAQQVADAQQMFAELHQRAADMPSAGDGAPSQGVTQIAEHRRVLAPLFDPDTYVANETEAYLPVTMTSFDGTDLVDPRYAWYTRYEGEQVAAADSYTWSVESVMPDLEEIGRLGTTSVAQVIWFCRDTDTGAVLAWAQAPYHLRQDGQGAFSTLSLVVTSTGARYQAPWLPQDTLPNLLEGESLEPLTGDDIEPGATNDVASTTAIPGSDDASTTSGGDQR